MNISIIGAGYVGLVQGACFADTGNNVICMDIDEKKIKSLNRGIIPIYEPGLEELVKRNFKYGRLLFTTNQRLAVRKSKIIFLCLPTPQSENGAADLSHVVNVAKSMAKYINEDKIVISKSTVPVGTVDRLKKIYKEFTKYNVEVVSNPEFLKEGTAIQDSLKPDRIVIGTKNKKVISILTELYAPFIRTGSPILVMDERSAELTKYAANAYLATKISFMNELANLCEKVGADIDWIRKGIGSDPRIGKQFLFPGVGYGGSCFPKDVKALINTAQENKFEFRILNAVDEVNSNQKKVLVHKIFNHFKGKLKGLHVTIWGLSFKPQTDDMREAPSIEIINSLLQFGVRIKVHDPIALSRAKQIYKNRIEYYKNNYDALKESDALIIITEWNEFRKPDFSKMKSLMKKQVIFDGRNIYNPKEVREAGFVYYGIGRKNE